MARKKWRRKKKPKKRYRRRRRKARIPLPLNGFPTKMMVRHKYCETLGLNPPAAGIATQTWRANVMYDPDRTSTGHQPRGYDEIGLNYNHYTVVGAKIKMTPCGPYNRTTVTGAQTMYGIALRDTDSFPYTSYIDLCESRFAGAGKAVPFDTNGMTRSVTKTFSAKKFFGVSKIVGLDPYKGNVGSIHADMEQAFFVCWATSPAGLDPDPVSFIFEIEYIAVWTEPRYLVAS